MRAPERGPQGVRLTRSSDPTAPGVIVRNIMLLAFAACVALRADAQTGFLDRTITVDGQAFRYQVYVPADYAVAKPWPVIVSLHGNGQQGSDGLLQTATDFAIRIRGNR